MVYSAAQDRYDKMPVRRSGHSGLQLPILSLGLWRGFGSLADYDNSRKTVLTAFDHGIFTLIWQTITVPNLEQRKKPLAKSWIRIYAPIGMS